MCSLKPRTLGVWDLSLKKTSRLIQSLLVTSVAAVALSACGGGGSSAQNRSPTLSGSLAGTAITGVEYTSQLSASDPDGDTLSWSVSGAPAWLAINPNTGRLSGIPTLSDTGFYSGITVRVSDGSGSASFPFNLEVVANTVTATSISLPESDGPARIAVSLINAADISLSVAYETVDILATANEDYLPANGILVFSPGQRQQFVEIEIIDNVLFEGDKTFELRLASVNPYLATAENSTATITILNDDPMPSLSAVRERIFANEGSTVGVEFELSSASGLDTTFSVSTAGTATVNVDFNLPSSPIVIPAGMLIGTVPLTIFADSIDQFDQATILSLDTVDFARIDENATATEVVIDDWRGTVLIGTTGADEGWAIDIDGAGNLYVVGRTTGSLYGAYDGSSFAGFAERRSRTGALQWGYQAPTFQKLLSDAALDSSDNLVVTGLESTTLAEYFVEKLDAAGLLIWKATIPVDGAGSGLIRSVTIDNSADIIIAGWIGSSFDGNTHYGRGDAILAKFSSSGNLIWARQFGSTGHEEATGVTVDSVGAIYVIGYTFEGDVDGGGEALTADSFIAKYDVNGNQMWIKQYRDLLVDQHPETDVLYLSHLKFSPDGFLYATGATTGTVGDTSFGSTDIPIAKLDLDGQVIWITQVGTSAVDSASAIDFLSDGKLVVGGYTSGAVEGATNTGGRDGLVMLVDETTGDVIWQTQFGSSEDDEVRGLAVSAQDEIFITGVAGGGLFEGEPPVGGRDAVILKIDSAGNLR